MGKATIIEAQNSNTVYEEGNNKGILGKLKGVFADYKNGTRNSDRLYTEELWDNRVFGSEDVMEALETKTLFGELDHPDGDRCETLAKNAAITITKLEKRPEEGVIYGEAEILDTPTGRIVKALADSGAKLGISSRGMGEEIFVEGKNIIDPETYDFITFDVVVTPANTKARVSLTESKHLSKLTENLKKEITESETENQLNQIKTVVETMDTSNKTELLNMIEEKLNPVEDTNKAESKLEEAVNKMTVNALKEKLNEQMNIVKETSKALEQLTNENKKLVFENAIKANNIMKLKENLKQHKTNLEKLNESLKSQEDEINKLESNVTDLTGKLEEANNNSTTIAEMEQANELKLEKLTKINNVKLSQVINSNNKLLDENAKLTTKYNNLMESNKKLMQSISNDATNKNNLLEENKQLKAKVIELENLQKAQAKKLTESKLQEQSTIAKLEAQVKELTESKAKMEEANQNFARLSFNPIGTVKAVAENFKSDEYNEEDLALYNTLINN